MRIIRVHKTFQQAWKLNKAIGKTKKRSLQKIQSDCRFLGWIGEKILCKLILSKYIILHLDATSSWFYSFDHLSNSFMSHSVELSTFKSIAQKSQVFLTIRLLFQDIIQE